MSAWALRRFWASGVNKTQPARVGVSSRVTSVPWESRSGHMSEALARQGPRLGWGLDRWVMKTLLTRRCGCGAPAWVQDWPLSCTSHLQAQGTEQSAKNQEREGPGHLSRPHEEGPQKAPHFILLPPSVPLLSPARTGRHGACRSGGCGPASCPLGHREDAKRWKVPALPGAALTWPQKRVLSLEGRGLQPWRSASSGGSGGLVPAPRASAGSRVRGWWPQLSGRCLRLRSTSVFSGCLL